MITFRECVDCNTRFNSALEFEMMSTVGISLDSFEVKESSKEAVCPECGGESRAMYGPCASGHEGKWHQPWIPSKEAVEAMRTAEEKEGLDGRAQAPEEPDDR